MRKNYFLMALALMFVGSVGNAKVNGADGNAEARDAVEAVDLGLSVKWANMNVGATKDSGFGSYFAWGETKPKNYYSWDNYAWSQGNTKFLLKYTNTDRRAQLVPSDDDASYKYQSKRQFCSCRLKPSPGRASCPHDPSEDCQGQVL